MDAECGVDGEAYYRQRLAATAYGQWLVWLNNEKVRAVDNEERAVRCWLFSSRLKAITRLDAVVSSYRRTSYHLRLANALRSLVLLNKGLQRWRAYRCAACMGSEESWALYRRAQQRGLFRALCKLQDAAQRRGEISSRLLSTPRRKQLASGALERWAEFTARSLRSRSSQQRKAVACWRRQALKRAVGASSSISLYTPYLLSPAQLRHMLCAIGRYSHHYFPSFSVAHRTAAQ
jgi:hypothetical protein